MSNKVCSSDIGFGSVNKHRNVIELFEESSKFCYEYFANVLITETDSAGNDPDSAVARATIL